MRDFVYREDFSLVSLSGKVFLVRLHGVLEKRNNGQRTHTAGHRSHPAAQFVHFAVLHVTDNAISALLAFVGNTMDAHIYHHCAFLDHISRHKLRLSDGHHQNIGRACQFGQVLRAAVAQRHRCGLSPHNACRWFQCRIFEAGCIFPWA